MKYYKGKYQRIGVVKHCGFAAAVERWNSVSAIFGVNECIINSIIKKVSFQLFNLIPSVTPLEYILDLSSLSSCYGKILNLSFMDEGNPLGSLKGDAVIYR